MKEENKKAKVRYALKTLEEYKSDKADFMRHKKESETIWKMEKNESGKRESTWLFNAIINKHADAMDALPKPVFLPREVGDGELCKTLNELIPYILESSSFQKVYDRCWYDKLKYGSACYGVFWDESLDGGLGNATVRRIPLDSIYFEGGVDDIQSSENVFLVSKVATDCIAGDFPELLKIKNLPARLDVIDWYYKRGGKLCYAKICRDTLLYCSEEDEEVRDTGFYRHGKYPFFIDTLYADDNYCFGYGLIDMMRGEADEIDALGTAIVDNARMASKRRFFVRGDGCVNEKEFADWGRPLVHYLGSGDPRDSIMPIDTPELSTVYVDVLKHKIEEMKETAANRDFSQGSVSGGVTAASAIAALQEAGGKTSRDQNAGSYYVFSEICLTLIELIKQFYTVPRCYRILGDKCDFKLFEPEIFEGKYLSPAVDVQVKARKNSPFARAEQNEIALEMLRLGLFKKEMRDEAVLCLEIMDFEGKNDVLYKIKEGDYGRNKGLQ